MFADTVPDPTSDVVAPACAAYHAGRHDSLISIGGGSPIDTAKAVGMIAANGGHARDYKVPNPIPNAGPPHIAIPTTAGTGSEVTRFTVIIDSERDEKMLIAGGALLPAAAVVDYELSMSMPPRLTADTGTDSLTHAIEAYVSRKANRVHRRPGAGGDEDHLGRAAGRLHGPGNRPAREAMMMAATIAGIAFTNASVALVHGHQPERDSQRGRAVVSVHRLGRAGAARWRASQRRRWSAACRKARITRISRLDEVRTARSDAAGACRRRVRCRNRGRVDHLHQRAQRRADGRHGDAPQPGGQPAADPGGGSRWTPNEVSSA